MHNDFADAVYEICAKYNVYGPFIEEAFDFALMEEFKKGRIISKDHVKQILVQWIKKEKPRMDAYWKEWREESNGERV